MSELTRENMRVGGAYNWKGQPDRLIYLGRNWSGNGYWHQFRKIGDPRPIWCEVLDGDLPMLEETRIEGRQDMDQPTLSLIQPKRPTGPGWHRIHRAVPALVSAGFPYEVWSHAGSGIGVISAVEVASEGPGLPVLGPAFHLSVSAFGERCTSADAVWAIAQFDLADATEDNHVPSGKVRHFWRYVADNLSGYECPCVDSEPVIRENKGDFIWRGAPR